MLTYPDDVSVRLEGPGKAVAVDPRQGGAPPRPVEEAVEHVCKEGPDKASQAFLLMLY